MIYRLSRTFAFVVAIAVALSVVSSGESWAQDSPDPKEILRRIQNANEQFENEEWEGAFEDYKAAFEMYPDNSLLYRMGLTAENMGDLFSAVKYYQQFVEAVPDDDTAKKIEERLPELLASLPARITVETTPPGATIRVGSVESEVLGETPATVDIPAGDVSLFVELDGYETELRNVRLTNGQEETFTFELVEVTGDPVEPIGGEPMDSGGMTLGTWGWVTTGVGVAVLATGGVFSFLALQGEDDVNTYDKRAPGASSGELADLKDTADSNYDTSVILYVAGGIVTATGITLIILDSAGSDSSESALNLNVIPTRDGGWVGLSGQF